jgi:hypothetical protein
MSNRNDFDWCPPRCPRCGSSSVREWGTISIGYGVAAISDDGEILNDESDVGQICIEGYADEHLICRECDYVGDDPREWIPRPNVVRPEN